MKNSAVFFDFDGVLADTEGLHFAAFNAALDAHADEVGGELILTKSQYLKSYSFYTDSEALRHMLADRNRPHNDTLITSLCDTKTDIMLHSLGSVAAPLPGVGELLALLEKLEIPSAVCSAAARGEIQRVLHGFKLLDCFAFIIAAEDVTRSKPDPECYTTAFLRLNAECGDRLHKEHCLVIEDSSGGAAAGRAAGIPVLGVATNLPLEVIAAHTDFSVPDLTHITADSLRLWLGY